MLIEGEVWQLLTEFDLAKELKFKGMTSGLDKRELGQGYKSRVTRR